MKNILFYFVHPAKFHFFKHTINELKKRGHKVDIAIVTKDVLEELVKEEGWEYTNIFPEGRRNRNLPVLLAAGMNYFKTLFRLYSYMKGKKYDLIITDDVITVLAWFKKIPSLVFIDDDISAVPHNIPIYYFASGIISPECTDLKFFTNKKIPVKSYKELAYLHPDYYKPDSEVIDTFNPGRTKYALLRLVSLTAHHDAGKKGISDDKVSELINLLDLYGIKTYISSERKLSEKFEPYRIHIKPKDIAHAVYFAEMFIGDSQTMTSEAAVLGTPSIRFNDFVGKINSMEEKEFKYGLTFGFRTNEFNKLCHKVEELLKMPDLKNEWRKRRLSLLEDTVDINKFLIALIEKYPN